MHKICSKFPCIKHGSTKIPPCIYHITSKSNYEKMLKSGCIKPSQDEFLPQKAIFAVDLKNLFKNWSQYIVDKKQNLSLLGKLLRHTIHGDYDIVMLKIPTKKLSLKDLKIRSQKSLFAHVFDNKQHTHVKKGAASKLSKLSHKHNEPFEYIYQGGEIPMANVEKIGEASVFDVANVIDNPTKALFTKLLKGTPESQEVERLLK